VLLLSSYKLFIIVIGVQKIGKMKKIVLLSKKIKKIEKHGPHLLFKKKREN